MLDGFAGIVPFSYILAEYGGRKVESNGKKARSVTVDCVSLSIPAVFCKCD